MAVIGVACMRGFCHYVGLFGKWSSSENWQTKIRAYCFECLATKDIITNQ